MPAGSGAPTNDFKYALTAMHIEIEDLPDWYTDESSIAEVVMTESLLTPSLHLTVSVQDSIYHANNNEVKNLDRLKGKSLVASFYKEDIDATLNVKLIIYRIDQRKLINNQIESYNIHCIDSDALSNVTKRMSKFYTCYSPSAVVLDALSIIGANHKNIEFSSPKRNYSAANILPYQVIKEQADAALNGGDPSYTHFMTFENLTGTHYFKSIKSMARQSEVASYLWTEKGTGMANFQNPYAVMSFEFPCDFDLLSDLMNGLHNNSSAIIENMQNGTLSLFGNQAMGTGTGGGLTKFSFTDQGTSDGCDVNVQQYLHLRQARIALLEQDKIALRMIVPFNPNLNAGKTLAFTILNKSDKALGQPEYGSGKYLICSLSHTIKAGGFGTTTVDCVADTTAIGEV